MTAAEQAFLIAMLDTSQAATAELREQVAKLENEAAELRDHDVNAAWTRIEKAAEGLVQKSRTPLSEAQAVARVLRERPELYSSYVDAQNDRHASIAKAADTTARRGLAEAAEERLAAVVRKGIDLGLTEDEAVDQALELRPDLAEACGVELPETIEKGAGALAAIEREAQREMARDRSVSHATATARALARNPALYTAYLAEVNGDGQPDDEAADEAWPPTTGSTASKSPLDGLKPRQRVEKAATFMGSDAAWWRRLREGNERMKEAMSR